MRDQCAGARHFNDPIDSRVDRVEEFNSENSLAGSGTSARRAGIPYRPLPRTRRSDSPAAEFSLGASSNVLPWNSGRLFGENASGALLDLGRPCGFNFGRVLGFGVIEARQQFRGQFRPFVDGPSKGFSQNLLRS
jgi:hypothetical protein